MKVLVLYYSFEGYTKALAELIAEGIGADIEGIKPVKELKSKGFSKYVWGGRQAMMGKSPAIEPIRSNTADYDVILIGTPVWAFTFAPPIKTLVEQGLLTGKRVGFFCTHEGGPGKTLEKFKNAIGEKSIYMGGRDYINDKKDVLCHKEKAIEWAKTCMEIED